MSRVDEVLRAAESLEPDDRLRLIARLCESLPRDHWAAPSAAQLAEIRRRLGDGDADPVLESPWALRQLLNRRLHGPQPKLYAATRRFDLATIFVAMAGYSILFGLMTLLEFQPFWKMYFGALIVVVGVGQALLEPIIDARRASVFVGAATHSLFSLILWWVSPGFFIFRSIAFVFVFNGLVCGAAMGYMAGVLVGGVFLVADVLRQRYGRKVDEGPDKAEQTARPAAAQMGDSRG